MRTWSCPSGITPAELLAMHPVSRLIALHSTSNIFSRRPYARSVPGGCVIRSGSSPGTAFVVRYLAAFFLAGLFWQGFIIGHISIRDDIYPGIFLFFAALKTNIRRDPSFAGKCEPAAARRYSG